MEAGCYVINFAACAQCGKREPLRTSTTLAANGIAVNGDDADGDRHHVDDDDDDDEEAERVQFEHACSCCGHVVARHEYAFQVDENFQNFSMMCLLCGRAEDTRSVLPDDPRLQPLY